MDKKCPKCKGTGFVDSGEMTSVIKGKYGEGFLKLSSPIKISVRCPKCNVR